ncbi:PucR family transcriptional regulator [Rhodococcus koreensis]
MSQRNSVTLGRILDVLAGIVLDVLAGIPDRTQLVRRFAVFDPTATDELEPGTLLLCPGFDTVPELLSLRAVLLDRGVHTVVIRDGGSLPGDTVNAFAGDDLAVLVLSPSISWTRAIHLLQTLLGTESVERDRTPSGVSVGGDLFAFADSVSALVDAPITIEDTEFRILAFSSRHGTVDQARITSVLDRKVPSEYVAMLGSRGVVQHLQRSSESVWIPPDGAESDLARVAVAIHSGGRYLGSLWAAVQSPLESERDSAFKAAAKMLAIHLLQRQLHNDAERRLNEWRMVSLLRGEQPESPTTWPKPTPRSFVVFALGMRQSPGDPESPAGSSLDELSDSLAVHLAALHPCSVAARIGDTVYAVLPTRAVDTEAERYACIVATDYLQRTQARSGVVIGVGRAVTRLPDLPRAREDADRARGVLQTARGAQRVATFGDVYIDYALQTLAHDAHAMGVHPLGPVRNLLEAGSQYVDTLLEWLESFGDVNRASAALHVHPNTFRYRLRRVREMLDVDLDDPDVRFRLLVQLRIARASDSWPTVVGQD